MLSKQYCIFSALFKDAMNIHYLRTTRNYKFITVHMMNISIFRPCYGRAMIWIQHHGVEKFFQYLRYQNGLFSSIKNLSKLNKKGLCKASIVLFSVVMDSPIDAPSSSTHDTSALPITSPNQKSKMLYPVIYPYNFRVKQTYSDNLKKNITSEHTALVGIGDEVIFVDVLPCIIYNQHSWYIANGYADNIYFTAESGPTDAYFSLTGMLETYPTSHAYRGDEIKQLENKFLMGQHWVVQTKKRTSLCRLDAFHKFRLCSTVYSAWLVRQPTIGSTWSQMQDFDDDMCEEGVLLHSNSDANYLSRVPLDLLPCAIIPRISSPEIYITADEAGLRSVFVVVARTGREGRKEFVLKMYVTNVTALINAMSGNLMVETLVHDDALELP